MNSSVLMVKNEDEVGVGAQNYRRSSTISWHYFVDVVVVFFSSITMIHQREDTIGEE
jgi:hypothetical protein